jgi:hypothetical protein
MNIVVGGVGGEAFGSYFSPGLHGLFDLFYPLVGCVFVVTGENVLVIPFFLDDEAVPLFLQ